MRFCAITNELQNTDTQTQSKALVQMKEDEKMMNKKVEEQRILGQTFVLFFCDKKPLNAEKPISRRTHTHTGIYNHTHIYKCGNCR